jgi:hypothetical protein
MRHIVPGLSAVLRATPCPDSISQSVCAETPRVTKMDRAVIQLGSGVVRRGWLVNRGDIRPVVGMARGLRRGRAAHGEGGAQGA